MRFRHWFFLVLVFVLAPSLAEAQTDTAKGKRVKRKTALNKLYKNALNTIQRNPGDTIDQEKIQIARAEQAFKRYEGKIIRYIVIHHYGFERTFTDTSRISYFGTKILNALHTDTREWVIRENLFFRENVPLIANKLADNERYLRTLDFIQDARIYVSFTGSSADSVDIVVITKDLFSITGMVDVSSIDKVRARVGEANFMGLAQRVQVTGLWEKQRSPTTGYEFLYSKTNIGGSFVNGTIAYTQINSGRSDGTEEERAFYLRFDRPLVSPFSHVAGGIELSFNQSDNVYRKPDSLFYDYQYNIYDVWAGYNLGTRRLREDLNYRNNRNRTFVAVRYLQTDFRHLPLQIGDVFDPIYNNKKGILAQVSFFRQDFYKLNYLYGFGSTEDVPTGYNISVTGGWYQQRDLERPYGGLHLHQYLVTPRGGFVDASFRAGGFLHDGELEDASTLASVNFFTRMFRLRRWHHRQFFRFSYTYLKNRVVYEPLRLDNVYGLQEFGADSVYGDRRISLYGESVLFTNRKIFGFRFAPFISGNVSVMTPELQEFKSSGVYTGLGGGLRVRNENLVFGTIELRASYFPNPVQGNQPFQVNLNSDIRFRYRTNFVRAPDIVQLNREEM